jgi:serine/threonine protein kinase/Flp pilus assembly protein TadD
MPADFKRVKEIFLSVVEKHCPAEQGACLREYCGDDTALRRQVEALLRQHAEAGSFLEPLRPDPTPVEHETTLCFTSDSIGLAEAVGTRLGPYTLIEKLGEGGMGAVWVAEQCEPVSRRVALKVIKPGMDSARVIRRFGQERQALALMDHENIAKVLDAGATPAGRPFFVMELIAGIPITRYCDEHRLSVRERLALFVPVCRALQHAHQKGVIHRDIKPSNVLVAERDGRPVPKVIDFGVAKALYPRSDEGGASTELGIVVGTLEYMSPEQAELSALDIDTRADVYALGVLLYELLTGTTPIDRQRLRDTAFSESLRIIKEEEPPRPSARLTDTSSNRSAVAAARRSLPACLARELRGELDCVVMKCLEKDRACRYETANALVRDQERYLADEPVEACPPSWRYRWGKFVRKHRGGLVTTAVALTALLVAVAAVAGSLGWATQEKASRDAELNRQVGLALDDAEVRLARTQWPEAHEALERADKLLGAAGRAARPERLAHLRHDLAMARRVEEIYSRPGEDDLLDWNALDADYALAFRDYGVDLAKLSPDVAAGLIRSKSIRLHLARTLDLWSMVRRRARAKDPPAWHQLLGVAKCADPEPWRDQLRDALAAQDRKALELRAESAPVADLPAGTQFLLGVALNDLGARPQAMGWLRRARRSHPEDLWINAELGRWCLLAREYDEARGCYLAALAVRPRSPFLFYSLGRATLGKMLWAEAAADFSRAIDLKPDYAMAYEGRGRAYLQLNQADKAIADYSKALAGGARGVWARYERPQAYAKLGRWQEASADYAEAAKMFPTDPNLWRGRTIAFVRLKQWDDALAALDKGLAVSPRTSTYWRYKVWIYEKLGRWDRAVADISDALRAHPQVAPAWYARAVVHARSGQSERAIDDFAKAMELDPEETWAWSTRAAAYEILEEWSQGRNDLVMALAKIQPSLFMKVDEFERVRSGVVAVAQRTPPKPAPEPPLSPGDDIWLQSACLRLLKGDVQGYKKVCQHLLEVARKSKQELAGQTAYMVSRTCLLHTTDGEDLSQLVRLAENAVASDPRAAWCLHTLSLAHYRAGRFDQAVRSCRQSNRALPRWGGRALNQLLLALAYERQGKRNEARDALRDLIAWREAGARGGPQRWPGSPPEMHLSDWLEFQLLYREAEGLFGNDQLSPTKPY